ncbi:hypothetical protein [uncultured Hyphomonas sp.]|uniref:hypothetical protein n=1 Tax=uncultured Hyphomonas sp. TaxID=225298 RepID=UPI002AAAFFDE|nr:hypothetical protein [uncultured Hyphomonas sp.]
MPNTVDAYITVQTGSSKDEVFDIICSIFRDSFSRRIIFANYMGPRIVADAELARGVRIEAFVQHEKGDLRAEGEVAGFTKDHHMIRFNFDSTAYHKEGDITRPTVEKGRKAEFIFLCKDGANGLCDLEIGVHLDKKMFGGATPQQMIHEVIRFLNSQNITTSDLPRFF